MAQGNPEISSNDKLHVSMLARLSDLDAGSRGYAAMGAH